MTAQTTDKPREQSTMLLTLPTNPTANPTLMDRLELRVALWLLLRNARRHRAAMDYDEHHRRRITIEQRARREHEALRAHALTSIRG